MSDIIQPVAVASDPGISPFPAPEIHQHRLFGEPEILTLQNGHVHSANNPLVIYESADWVVMDGIVDPTGAPSATHTMTNIPERYRPDKNLNFPLSAFNVAFPNSLIMCDSSLGAGTGNFVVAMVFPMTYNELHINSIMWRKRQ